MSDPLLPRPQRSQSNPVTVKYVPREVRMLSISEHELDNLASWDTSLYVAFLGLSFGAFVALIITIYTVSITDPIRHASFVSMMWVSATATIFLLIRVILSVRSTRKKLREMKMEVHL